MKQKILSIFVILCFLITFFSTMIMFSKPVAADVGSFQSYSSESSSSRSSSSSSSYDSYDYRDSDNDLDILWVILFLFNPNIPFFVKIIILVIIIIIGKVGFNMKKSRDNFPMSSSNDDLSNAKEITEETIITRIQENDKNFNADEFKAFAKDVFIKLQNAWTDRDWEKIRTFETNELFEQHKAQLDGYIRNNQINVMERICVNWVKLKAFAQSGEKEILTVDLNSRMGDYIIDATTKKVLQGNKTEEYTNTYQLKFIRTKGEKTPEGGQKVNITNCPNCGAPTKIMTSGRCDYCGSVITTSKHGWALGNLERK